MSLALLVVLETLSPSERAAFLLHDVFDYGYPEIAAALGRNQASCRQLVSRARRAVDEGRVRTEPDPWRRAEVATAFLSACGGGDVDDLLAVLAEDVIMRSDGGGSVRASRVPLHGARRCARALVALRTHSGDELSAQVLEVNGTPGVALFERGAPTTLIGVDVADERIVAIHIVREPSKLSSALAAVPAAEMVPVPLPGREGTGDDVLS